MFTIPIAVQLGFSAATTMLLSRKFIVAMHDNRTDLTSCSQVDMIDLFGRLPVHERQWIQHVMAVPGGGSAYESAAVTVYQGPVGVPSVFQHETGHAVDAYKNSVQSSTTPTFESAIVTDTCVPDDYSNTNEVEDYTQVSVLALFEIVNPGGLDPIGNWRCLVTQKNAVDTFQKDAMTPGGTCDRRWADSAIISMGPATGNGKRAATVGPKPAAGPQVGQPGVEAIPFVHKTEPRPYTNLVFNATEKANAVERQKSWALKAKRSERLARFEKA